MNKSISVMRTRNRGRIALLAALLVCAMCLTSCQNQSVTQEENAATAPERTVQVAAIGNINDMGINEDKTVYDADDPQSLVYFYVTVQKGDVGSGTDNTFAQVNGAIRFVNSTHVRNDIYARAIVQVGDENGPQRGMLGYGAEQSNATIRIRGNSSSTMPQKSYRLKLDGGAGLWRGQSNIALNKSIFDLTRFRNKLYFDMLKEVDDVPSLRTQFARLFIKDETAGDTVYTDYGFYTQVEVPSKRYLANHGLDKEGYLYKAINFNFEPSAGLKNFDDPDFDQEAFDALLSCKGRQDNSRLIRLVEMINDTSIDINDIIGPYIDRENYLSWMASNILLLNTDTTMQNFYIYSPTNSEKWYFIPWDGDGILPYDEMELEGSIGRAGAFERGITNYWGVVLHKRFLKYRENREALAQRVDELHEIINADTANARIAMYNEIVLPYVSQMPDLYHLGSPLETRAKVVAGLGEEIEEAYEDFYDTLEALMPFYTYPLEQQGEQLLLSWEEAYDFDNQEVSYQVIVSRYPDMREPVIKQMLDVTEYETTTAQLPPGTYYITVKASTADGRTAQPMNKIRIGEDYYPGVDVLEVR